MMYRSEAGDRRRLEGARMAHKRESIVPMTPVRDADRSARVVGLSTPFSAKKGKHDTRASVRAAPVIAIEESRRKSNQVADKVRSPNPKRASHAARALAQ